VANAFSRARVRIACFICSKYDSLPPGFPFSYRMDIPYQVGIPMGWSSNLAVTVFELSRKRQARASSVSDGNSDNPTDERSSLDDPTT
jgi:hypothetical protein